MRENTREHGKLGRAEENMERLTHKAKHEAGYKANRNVHVWECVDKLGQLEDLEEQGKLLKLPCAVGDTVYRINNGKKEPVIPMQVIGIAIRNENELVIQTKDIADDNHNLYSKNSIGKSIFLTKESAEAALKN